MTLAHDFWLIREGERAYNDFSDLLGRRDAPIHIHDDLMSYFWDMFKWIPTCAQADEEIIHFTGFNRWGETIITAKGAIVLYHLCQGWIQIFEQAPQQFELTGPYGWSWPYEEETVLLDFNQATDLGSYEKLLLNRNELLAKFRLLAEFAEKAATEAYFILHLGI